MRKPRGFCVVFCYSSAIASRPREKVLVGTRAVLLCWEVSLSQNGFGNERRSVSGGRLEIPNPPASGFVGIGPGCK